MISKASLLPSDEALGRRQEWGHSYLGPTESGTRGYRDRQCTALMFPMLPWEPVACIPNASRHRE